MTATLAGGATAPHADPVQRADLVAGARAMSALVVTYVPFALLVGSAVAASADPEAAWLATWGIYGGAAHLALLQVLAQGSGWLAAAAVGLLVNLRLAAYAAAMAPHWRETSLRLRIAAAVMLTDAPWALANSRTTGRRGYYLGAALTLFLAWPVMVTAGVFVGSRLTSIPVADLLPVITLGALVVTQLRDRAVAWAVALASVLAVVTVDLDGATALLLCATAGVVAGMVAERRS